MSWGGVPSRDRETAWRTAHLTFVVQPIAQQRQHTHAMRHAHLCIRSPQQYTRRGVREDVLVRQGRASQVLFPIIKADLTTLATPTESVG